MCLILASTSLFTAHLYASAVVVDYPADSLRANLLRLGQQTRISIFFAEETVAGVQVGALQGQFSPAQILKRWTETQCLEFEFIREDFVAITPASSCHPVAAAEPSVVEPQTREPPQKFPALEEIIVRDRHLTGSRLRGVAAPSATLDVIDHNEIRLSGLQTLGEILRYVPAVSGNSTSTLISNGGDGTASITLRGLPASNTLVLLNGQRLNPNALDGKAIDLNSLPLPMVDRVEILKDGVSAVYGSDAIAGVVNIITKDVIDGVEVDVYRGGAEQGDLATEQFSLQAGRQGSRWSTLWGISHYRQQGIFSRDRSRSESSDDRLLGGIDKRSSATVPALVNTSAGYVTLNQGADGSSAADFRPVTSEDRFEYRDYTSSIVPSNRQSGFGRINWQLSPQARASVDLLYAQTFADAYLAPVPVFTGFESIPLTIDSTNIYNPFGEDLEDVRRRVTELASRRQENTSKTFRLASRLHWQGEHIEVAASLQHDRSRAKEKFRNSVRADTLAQALGPDCLAPCVPVNLLGAPGSLTDDMLTAIRTDASIHGDSELTSASIEFDWFSPWIFSQLVAGLEVRHETLRVSPDAVLMESLLVGGGNRGATSGNRDVAEAYAELSLPILTNERGRERLSAQVAARYANYSDFGGVLNPRLVVDWRLNNSWNLRATVGRGFRAPTLRQLYGSRLQSFEQLNDPCSVPAAANQLSGCSEPSDPSLNQVLTFTGGESRLDPERSQTVSVALNYARDWSRLKLRGGVSWYLIEQQDVVESSAQFIINQNARTGAFSERVERDANGNLRRVVATLQNIGRRDVDGLDINISADLSTARFGEFKLAMNATRILSFKDKFDPDTPTVEKAGTFSDEASGGLGGLPDWKVNVGASWRYADWQLGYNIYYISSLVEDVPLSSGLTRRVDDWMTHNVNLGYTSEATRGVRITLGVNNLFDRQPPFSAAAFNDSYDGRTYDITGRYFFVRLDTAI